MEEGVRRTDTPNPFEGTQNSNSPAWLSPAARPHPRCSQAENASLENAPKSKYDPHTYLPWKWLKKKANVRCQTHPKQKFHKNMALTVLLLLRQSKSNGSVVLLGRGPSAAIGISVVVHEPWIIMVRPVIAMVRPVMGIRAPLAIPPPIVLQRDHHPVV
jgi:hypothetical protein